MNPRLRKSVVILEKAPLRALSSDVRKFIDAFKPKNVVDFAQKYYISGHRSGRWAISFTNKEDAEHLIKEASKSGLLIFGGKLVNLQQAPHFMFEEFQKIQNIDISNKRGNSCIFSNIPLPYETRRLENFLYDYKLLDLQTWTWEKSPGKIQFHALVTFKSNEEAFRVETELNGAFMTSDGNSNPILVTRVI